MSYPHCRTSIISGPSKPCECYWAGGPWLLLSMALRLDMWRLSEASSGYDYVGVDFMERRASYPLSLKNKLT